MLMPSAGWQVSMFVNVIIFTLIVLSFVVSPIMLIWGWIRWVGQPKLRTVSSIFSLSGFILVTASALLAVSTMAYAQVHTFQFYDPSLLRIFRWGVVLSIAGLLFGMGGVWQKNSLRWHAPVCALGTLAFWILAAAGE
jgi:hypothetical protein